MDMGKLMDWLKDVSSGGKVIIVVIAIVATAVIVALYPDSFLKIIGKSESSPSTAQIGTQFNAPFIVKDNAKVEIGRTGDTHNHYGYDDEKVAQLAAKLAQEFRKENADTIERLEAAVKALTEQPANQPGIKEALDMLSQGKTELAENIFARIALEEKQKGQDAQQKGKEANIKEAEALRHLGSLAYLHDTQKALNNYQRSTELNPDNMDGWNQLGHLYNRIGELAKSENAYMTVLKLAGTDPEYQAKAYGNLGLVYKTRGELDQAVEYHEKALGLNEALGYKEGVANNYGNLGIVYQTRGDLDKALEYYQKALGLNEALGRKEGMAKQYGNLGIVYQTRGELDKALEYYQKSLVLNQELGAKEGMAIQYGNLGIVYKTRGDLDQAVEYYQKALGLNQELGAKEGIANQYGNLGAVYEIQGDLPKAVEFWQKSLALFTEVGMKPQMAKVQSWLDEANPKKAE